LIGLVRVALVAIPATLWYSLRVLVPAALRSRRMRCHCEIVARNWSRTLLWAAGVRVVLEDEERIDPDRAQVLVANHVSWFDVLVLAGHLPGTVRFVGKKELARVPFFGAAWKACGHIAIDRSDRAAAIESLAEARRLIEEEHPTMIFFPEGTRSETGELRSFKKGAFVLAIQTGVEVIPAAILGSREVMRKGSWSIRTGRTVRVRFGTPVPVDGLDVDDRSELTLRGRDAVAALLAGG
jgi:1-acyl-sn-glycerol-3-phosphate acyltransferase